jgi:DNA polymerase-3 subunit alpha
MGTTTDFVHLRTHSHYSLLSAPVRIPALVRAAQADGQQALGLTDSGNLFGAIEFYKACRGADLRPILGMVALCAAESRTEPTSARNPNYQLTLLAENAKGWDNLKRLSSIGFLEGFYFRPRIDREVLAKHAEGLIVLTGDLTGEIGRSLQADDTPTAARTLTELREMFGENQVFLEIQRTGIEAQQRVNPLLVELGKRTGTPLVATQDVHYLTPDDAIAQDIMLCIRNGKTITDPNRMRMPSRELWFKSREDMAALYHDLPEAVTNTVAIAERCQVEIDFKTYHLPVFDAGPDETPVELFRRTCREGAIARYGAIDETIEKRLEYEMGVIEQLGFESYFLITADFIDHARAQGIPVGPGRGSAAGSMVAYVMRITDLDPLKYNLIFERFLNVERVSMPDIDIDFCGNRRDEVIQYVRDKYGSDCVSQIITFGTMASRGVLRDVGRVLEVPLPEIDRIAKKVQQGPGASLTKSLDADPELQAIREENDTNRRLFELGLKLEGLARHNSIHAAGVVVADRPLADYVPLAKNGDDIMTQWQMTELEEVGLLKVDFLGLKTLTILTEAVRLIEKVHGEKIDLSQIPLDDPDTFALMTRGETLGVFQLESSGMRELLGKLKPDTFEDVIAVLALYRPGPLGSGMVDMFCDRKHGTVPVEYPHEDAKPVLEETYGVIVYQEQVMRIANVIADFSMNEADSLRKAMGKKKPEVMEKFKGKFVDGAEKRGHRRDWAQKLFETIEYFAGYGFNKSHSAAYALITYQTAWLKAHWPVEFVAANMTVESGATDKLKEYVDEARRMGIEIRRPDVNTCEAKFDVDGKAVLYGLGAIKGVGTRAAEQIAEQRRAPDGGPYKSLEDLCGRLEPGLANRSVLEALIKAGALDQVEPSRQLAFDGLEGALRAAMTAREDKKRGQKSLFGLADAPPPPAATRAGSGRNGKATNGRGGKDGGIPEWSEQERLTREKEALGFYLSGHPFAKRGRFLSRIAGCDSRKLRELSPEEGEGLRLAGMLSGIQIITIKQGRNAGKKMAKCLLEDLHGVVPMTVFSRAYETIKEKLVDDALVFVKGRLDKASEEPALLVEDIVSADSVVAEEVRGVVVHLDETRVEVDRLDNLLDGLSDAVQEHKGGQRFAIEITELGRRHLVHTDGRFNVRIDEHLLERLTDLVGPERVSFVRR